MGGSMGSVVGEKLTRLIEYATQEGLTLMVVCTSGGARMQVRAQGRLRVSPGAPLWVAAVCFGRCMCQHPHRLPRDAHKHARHTPTTGGHHEPDADGQDQRRAARAPERGQPALHLTPDQPHHGRRDRELWHAGRHHHRRAAGHHRVCWAARDRADAARGAARRLPGVLLAARVRQLVWGSTRSEERRLRRVAVRARATSREAQARVWPTSRVRTTSGLRCPAPCAANSPPPPHTHNPTPPPHTHKDCRVPAGQGPAGPGGAALLPQGRPV
jgi:hypothetical protein